MPKTLYSTYGSFRMLVDTSDISWTHRHIRKCLVAYIDQKLAHFDLCRKGLLLLGSNTALRKQNIGGFSYKKTPMSGQFEYPNLFHRVGYDTRPFQIEKAMPILANLGIPPVLHMTLLNINANLENVSITKCVPIHQYPANALPKPGLLQISSNFTYSY